MCSLGDGGHELAFEVGREYGVQERVGARVDREEEDEQYLALGDVDERVPDERGEAEKDNGRGAHEVRADQYGYLTGHGRLARGRVSGLVAQRHVDLNVTEQYQQEGGGRERQQREHVAHAAQVNGVHGQADAANYS